MTKFRFVEVKRTGRTWGVFKRWTDELLEGGFFWRDGAARCAAEWDATLTFTRDHGGPWSPR